MFGAWFAKNRRNRAASSRRFRPTLLCLEDRLAPATFTWSGLGNGNWSDAANWQEGQAPDNGDDLIFPAGANRTDSRNDSLGGISSLTFEGSGYTVATTRTGPMTVNNGIQNNASSGTNRVTLDIIFNNLPVFTSSGGKLTLEGTITGSGGADSSLAKTGNGELEVLAKNANYQGSVELDQGTLTVGNDMALGTGALRLVGGTLRSSKAATLPNSFTANATQVGGSADLTLTGAGTLLQQFRLVNSGGQVSFAGVLAGDANSGLRVSSTGTGTVALLASNTFAGGTVLDSGTLAVGNNNALGTGSIALRGAASRP